MNRLLRRLLFAAALIGLPVAAGAGAPNTDWMMYNGNYLGDRYSPLAQINRQNVSRLRPVCAFQLGELGPMQAGPVIHNGVMFVTNEHDTIALDATNCKVKWTNVYKATGIEQGRANRGVALLDGKVYRGTPDAHLLALDEATGKTIWDIPVRDSADGSSTISAPIAWKNLVFMGSAGSELGVRAKMYAFGASDGHLAWTFDLIPSGDEAGANTWENPDTALTGGGGTWSSFALNPADGTLFIPVGNPAPDFLDSYRPGANLYTSSIVALDAMTGKLRWYYQAIPHDFHDWDMAAAPAIFKAANGRQLITFAPKNGYLYTVDYKTHKLLNKVAVTTVANQSAPLSDVGTHFCPSIGGTEWNGPAYSSTDKLTYVDAVDWCTTVKLGTVRYISGHSFLGSANGYGTPDASSTGWLTAVDPLTGRVAWKFHGSSPMVSAVTPTAGGLVFGGETQGNFYAFNSTTGKVLYTFNTGGSVAGGVASYAVDGKQYLAVTSGNQSRTTFLKTGAPIVFVFAL
jgi:PQQ-dependent dehydrogenase (methanol/ethanol family)